MKWLEFVAAFLAFSVNVSLPAEACAQEVLDDEEVESAVKDRLTHDPLVSAHGIDLQVDHGVLELRGTVPDLLSRERAEALAELVRGIRLTRNRLLVRPSARISPEDLSASIRDALREDPATEAFKIRVDVGPGGAVTLSGEVDSWGERELAETVTKAVRGASSVRSLITIRRKAQRPDREIAADVSSLLRWNTYLDHELIRVEVKEGVAYLSGVVASAAEKTRAGIYAYRAAEGHVVNELEVAHWSRDRSFRGKKYEALEDESIETAVLTALRVDPRVDATGVRVDVTGGKARLSGVVSSLRARRAALQSTLEVVGVRRVKDHLEVRPESRSDEELEQAVVRALGRDPLVDLYDLSVLARGSRVFLRGEVDSHFERAQAGEVVGRVRGVSSVINSLSVARGDSFAVEPALELRSLSTLSLYDHALPVTSRFRDEVVEANIEDLLSWHVYVNAGRVGVSVEGGIAYLEGQVGSPSERDIAVRIAFAGGAKEVRNRLGIEPEAVDANYVR